METTTRITEVSSVEDLTQGEHVLLEYLTCAEYTGEAFMIPAFVRWAAHRGEAILKHRPGNAGHTETPIRNHRLGTTHRIWRTHS